MSRRLAAPVLLSAILIASFAEVAAGADPDVVEMPPKNRGAEQPSTGDKSPEVGSGRTPQTAPGANGRIAFSRSPFDEFPNVIWSMASNGSDQLPLTPSDGTWEALWPAYSPGGTMIAFTRDMVTGNDAVEGDIYVMQANGTGRTRLTSTSTSDVRPVWTPDGSRLVFTSYRTGNGDVYSMKIDGTDVRRLTTNTAIDSYPSVSPDGTRIAFASDRDGDLDVYTMNIDGSAVTQLTNETFSDYQPDWSPDGSKIAFTSLRTFDAEVFVMPADGGTQTNLTNEVSEDLEPSWSPDGTQIAYWSQSEADSDVKVMLSTGLPTGGPGTTVGATTNDEWGPDWQPIPDFPLVDARFSSFESYIVWVYEQGITSGCSSERYCPNDSVTRGQMASFLARALHLSGPAPDAFTDDETSVHEVNINLVAREGIASGCGVNLFCPAGLVKRDQMASFLSRALHLSGPAPNAFTDDNGNLHEVNINLVAREGIASGCGGTNYCPSANVTRGQMAAFLFRAFAP